MSFAVGCSQMGVTSQMSVRSGRLRT